MVPFQQDSKEWRAKKKRNKGQKRKEWWARQQGGPRLLETQVPPPVQQAMLQQPSLRLQVFNQVLELIHLLYKFRLAILFCYKATGS